MTGISKTERALREAAVWNAGFDGSRWRAWARKYNDLRARAPRRGIECRLTFEQYLKLAVRAGLSSPDDIGLAPHNYCMGRKGDVGNYVWGNCRFITVARNHRELTTNGGRILGGVKISEALRGRTKVNDSARAAQSDKVSRSFVALSPSGKKHRGRNVKAFCLERGLHPCALSAVFRGKYAQHKGWTGYYV